MIGLITGHDVRYMHPALFRTKGQVLHGLARLKPNAGEWLVHRSCSHDARHASQDGRFMHCGVCGNCLLRRVSLLWAGVQDSTRYRAGDLSAETLNGAFAGSLPKGFKSVADLAFNSVRSMHRLANLADDVRSLRVQAEVAGLARGLGERVPEVNEKMEVFLKQHQAEWQAFLRFCGPKSWVAQLAEA